MQKQKTNWFFVFRFFYFTCENEKGIRFYFFVRKFENEKGQNGLGPVSVSRYTARLRAIGADLGTGH